MTWRPSAPRQHGTLSCYRAGCRIPECRSAATEAARRYRQRPPPARTGRSGWAPILCGNCGSEVEGCAGRYVDWMHCDSRSERCTDGQFARPETYNELARRVKT